MREDVPPLFPLFMVEEELRARYMERFPPVRRCGDGDGEPLLGYTSCLLLLAEEMEHPSPSPRGQ